MPICSRPGVAGLASTMPSTWMLDDVGRRLQHGALDGVLHCRRRAGAAVAAAFEAQLRDAVVVDAEELDPAGVRAEIRTHLVQRRLHPGVDVVGVQVVQHQQVRHQVVVGEPAHDLAAAGPSARSATMRSSPAP